MFTRKILALSTAALMLAGAAQAQENATLVLRSGERVAGQLLDHGGVGFTIRVNNEERRIPTNDVAIVEFVAPPMTDADWARVAEGTHLVWLRSGEIIAGHFYDIGGTTPLNITLKTTTGDRAISSSEIARIVLARLVGAAVPTTGTAATPAPAGGGIAVPARQNWTATGLVVRRGEIVEFNTTGDVQLSGDTSDLASSAGSKGARMAPASAPLPGVLAGALIGRIGNGRPFPIGDQTSLPMPASGQLFLGINDDHLGDNVGEFRVEIRRTARRR